MVIGCLTAQDGTKTTLYEDNFADLIEAINQINAKNADNTIIGIYAREAKTSEIRNGRDGK